MSDILQDPDRFTRKKLFEQADFPDARVLEVGCGDGRVTAMYDDATRFTVGLEPERGALAEARQLTSDACFVCGSGTALPFAAASFDVVLFTLSLHHNPDPAAALIEAARTSAPGGKILVLDPSPRSEIQRLCNAFYNENHRLEAAARAMTQSGLDIVGRESFETNWFFPDAQAVLDYAFEYFDHPEDETKSESMLDFLGDKAGDRPIRMTDTLVLTALLPG
jgi:ubiquinone/menaquinone biosynthesis C-methylase UbiE